MIALQRGKELRKGGHALLERLDLRIGKHVHDAECKEMLLFASLLAVHSLFDAKGPGSKNSYALLALFDGVIQPLPGSKACDVFRLDAAPHALQQDQVLIVWAVAMELRAKVQTSQKAFAFALA